MSQQVNGTSAERAVMLLNALPGNIDVPGGYSLPRRYALREPDPAPVEPQAEPCAACTGIPQFFQAISERSERVGLVVNNMANPVFTAPNGGLIANVLKNENLVPHHVVFDSFLTETAMLADMVLPAATYLESWGVHSNPSMDMVPYLSIMQPAIKPVGEATAVHDVLIELGKRVGGNVAKHFAFGNIESYLTAAVGEVNGLDKAGGLDYLKRFGVYIDPGASRNDYSYEGLGFKTPSGRFEINLAGLEPHGQALPMPGADQAHEEQLSLITFQFSVHSYGRTADSMWLSEIVHDNPVWIHPERAAELGIKRGDEVTLQTEAGTIHTKAWPTEAIHPDVLAIGMGVGRAGGSRIARSHRFKSDEPNTEHVWWDKHAGVHPYPLIRTAVDPVGGAPSWSVSQVTISKA